MKKNLYLSASFLSLVLSSAQVDAAASMPLQHTSFVDLQRSFQLVLPGLKQSGPTSTDTLRFVKQHTDEKKITHVRMQQHYAGFPVFGGYAIFHSQKTAQTLLSAKQAMKMNGTLYQGLQSELGQPSALFVTNAKVALQQFKTSYQGYSLSEEQVTPIVYIDEDHHAFWAYRMSVLVSHNDGIPERPTAIVDAKTFKPFKMWNDIKTSHTPVNGKGFGGNARTGKYQYGKEAPLLSLSRDDATATCYMENEDVKVVDMAHEYGGHHHSMHFSCTQDNQLSDLTYWTGYQSDGYDKENGAFSPSNDALHIGGVIKDMYKGWYGIQVLTQQQQPMRLVLRVHFGEAYENAFWDGRQMTFGDGEDFFYPLVSLGVGAHEISHGFTEQHANLEYTGQSGGMNESFSDMAAQAAEYYAHGKSSWMIGSELMKRHKPKALRFMDTPSLDGISIDSADMYYDGIDVHHSSGVYNRFFYLLATQPQWDVRKAFHVMVKANMDYWVPNSTFEDGACGVINAANDLGYPLGDVKAALDKVVINYQNCGL